MNTFRKLAGVLTAALMAVTLAAPMTAQAATVDTQAYAAAVVTLVNKERTAAGLTPLQSSGALDAAALTRSLELPTLFSHTRPDGRSSSTTLDDLGIAWRACGENIAYGYATPEAVMDGWMHSEGHRANILSTNFTYIGVGVAEQNGTLYWTQTFTGGVAPTTTVTAPETNTPAPTTPQPSVQQPCIGEACPVTICPGGDCSSLLGGSCTSPANLLGTVLGSGCSPLSGVVGMMLGGCTR